MFNCAEPCNTNVTGLVLAGGQSRRMNYKSKGLIPFLGKPLCQHVIDRLKPQVTSLVINSNQNLDVYREFGYPVIKDLLEGYLGPLAGIHAGLSFIKTDWMLVSSCDTPFLPTQLLARFIDAQQKNLTGNRPLFVESQQKMHPTFMLIHRQEREKIEHYLKRGERRLMLFLESINAVAVDFSDISDAFININTPDDLLLYQNQ